MRRSGRSPSNCAARRRLEVPTQAPLRQVFEAGEARADEGIAGVFALQHGTEREAGGQFHRHVLERMHGQVGAALFQGGFKLLDEQPLAADLGQRTVEDLVATGGHAQQFDLQPEPGAQQVAYMFGLPQGKAAFAGGDDGGVGHGACIIASRPGPAAGAQATDPVWVT